jgi:hypothetical protein
MVSRRSLIAGLNPDENIDPDEAENFIAGRDPRQRTISSGAVAASSPIVEPRPPAAEQPPSPQPLASSSTSVAAVAPSPLAGVGRVPIGARVRTDLAVALKRASLERQLTGREPFAIQDILEDAITMWLLKNGHLP